MHHCKPNTPPLLCTTEITYKLIAYEIKERLKFSPNRTARFS